MLTGSRRLGLPISTLIAAALLLAVPAPFAHTDGAAKDHSPPPGGSADSRPQWHDLLDGNSLKGWQVTPFGGEGEVRVENNRLMLEFGAPLTGVTYTKEFPESNYEIRLQAMRLAGTDFFCALTFPVGQSHASLVVGGWGGGVTGLSSIDGRDASDNDTTRYMALASQKWHDIRIRVTDQRIQAWINDKQTVDQAVAGHAFDTRPEVDLSKPLGIASFETRAALRNIQFCRLTQTAGQKSNSVQNQ